MTLLLLLVPLALVALAILGGLAYLLVELLDSARGGDARRQWRP